MGGISHSLLFPSLQINKHLGPQAELYGVSVFWVNVICFLKYFVLLKESLQWQTPRNMPVITSVLCWALLLLMCLWRSTRRHPFTSCAQQACGFSLRGELQGQKNTRKWVARELQDWFYALLSVVPWSEAGLWVYHTELTGGTKRLLARNRAEPPPHVIISQAVVQRFMSLASLGSISIWDGCNDC